jgi:hypothetical protein
MLSESTESSRLENSLIVDRVCLNDVF